MVCLECTRHPSRHFGNITGNVASRWSTNARGRYYRSVLLHIVLIFLVEQKKEEKKELNKQKIPNRKSTFLHFLLVLNLLFLFYFTEDGRFTNALYIKYLYVFVKQTYDASGFL